MEKDPGIAALPDALLVLQTPSAPFEHRLNALRFLSAFLAGSTASPPIDEAARSSINKLLFDSLLEMIMGEDRSANLRKRQLIRTECFIMLSNVLKSQTLFGDAYAKIQISELFGKIAADIDPAAEEPAPSLPVAVSPTRAVPRAQSAGGGGPAVSEGTSLLSKTSSVVSLDASDAPSRSPTRQPRRKLVYDTLQSKFQQTKVAHLRVKKGLKPRQGIIFGSSYDKEHFIPGSDPSNWSEHDRRLGYRKERMWFPFSVGVNKSIIPLARAAVDPHGLEADQIVKEYKQMKALMSYVGDLVMVPPGGAAPTPGKPREHGKGPSPLEAGRYDMAVREAVSMWTPLLGSHLPPHARKLLMAQSDSLPPPAVNAVKPSQPTGLPPPPKKAATVTPSTAPRKMGSIYDTPAHAPAKTENSVLLTKRILKELREMELSDDHRTKASVRSALNAIMSDRDSGQASTGMWPKHVRGLQGQIAGSLSHQLETVENSARVLRALMLDTIKLQYAQMPPRYLVVLEKEEPSNRNPRQILLRALRIFVRVKERTLLALAMGTWRICLVQAQSDAKRAQYRKVASCHLIRNWIRDRKFKQFKQWVVLWRSKVAKVIFLERFNAVIPIQTLYRRWRDRKIFLRMHSVRPYNGPLSDIYLGADRSALPGVKFIIPPLIRNSRRIYWRAAIKVQTRYRGYKQGKLYKKRIKQIVVLQSVCRMFPKRKQFLRLKRITIYCQACMRGVIRRKKFIRWRKASYIVQKYVRRFLAIMQKWRMLEAMWSKTDLYIPPAIRIQCRWRIFLARRKVRSIKFETARTHWGALVMQRNWYRLQNAFHTFVLMCSYRAREGVDKATERRKVYIKRFHNCRVIQRAYRQHYFKRSIAAAVKLQCWYRGRCGYSMVHILRRNKMAARRLHHWARGMMKKKHAFVRKIQRTWWRAEPGRLRRHLMNRARLMDIEEERLKRLIRGDSAARMQAVLRGIWARRWVIQHKAALKIQRSSRFFISRLMWKKQIRERAAKAIKKSVGSMIGRGLVSATNIWVRYHNIYVARVQALIRGVVLRCHFRRAKAFAFRLGLAVVIIQRFWRKSGAFMKAVQEVMALRRLDTNPYRSCENIHEILLQMRAETKKYYSSTDPRCGLTVTTFLRRLGLYPEYVPMFPARDFRLVSDLQRLDEERMVILYNRNMIATDKKPKQEKSEKDKRKPSALAASAFDALPAPVRQAISSMLAALKPDMPIRTAVPEDRLAVSPIAAVPEIGSGHAFKKSITEIFVRRFGTGYQSRVENLVSTLCEQIWHQYSNFRSVGYFVLTEAQIARAIAVSKTPSDVKAKIDAFQAGPQVSATLSPAGRTAAITKILAGELEWDTERTRLAADMLQLAAEKAVMIVPQGSILSIIQTAMHYVGLYKRRFSFLLAKLRDVEVVDEATDEKADDDSKTIATDAKSAPESASSKPDKMKKGARKQDAKSKGKKKKKGLEEEETPVRQQAAPTTPYLSAVDSVGRTFYSKRYEEGVLEMNVCICKIYMEAFDRIYVASKGIQSIKNSWQNAAMKRAIIKEQMSRFLDSNTAQYLKDRHENKVLIKWQKYRRAESVAARFNEILEARRVRLEHIDAQLYWVPRWGWDEALDARGYSYWYKTDALLNPAKPQRLRQLALMGDDAGEEPTWSYAMPLYSREEYIAAEVIQRPARVLVEAARERRRLKEEAKRTEVAAREAKLKEDMQANAGKLVRFRINIMKRVLPWLAKHPAVEGENGTSGVQSPVDEIKRGGRGGPDRSPSPHKDKKSKGRGMKDGKSPPRKVSPGKSSPAKAADKAGEMGRKTPPRRRGKPEVPLVPLTIEELEVLAVREAEAAYDAKTNLSSEDKEELYERSAVALLPFRLQFEPVEDVVYRTGEWILVKDETDSSRYRSAVIFNTNMVKKICDVRYISGRDEQKVSLARLVQFNLDVGAFVEVRYHGRKLFYRAKILKVTGVLKDKRYTVQYADGEVEDGVTRGSIRLSNSTTDELMIERKRFCLRMYLRVRREIYYTAQRERREAGMAARNLFRWQRLPEEIRNPRPPTPLPPVQDLPTAERLVDPDGNLIDEEGNIIEEDPTRAVGVTTDEGESDTPDGDDSLGSPATSPVRVSATVIVEGDTDTDVGVEQKERVWTHDRNLPQLMKAMVSLVYVKYPIRFGWTQKIEKDPNNKTKKIFTYISIRDGSVTDVPQVYNAEELFNIIKLQSIFKVRLARKLFKKMLGRSSISAIAKGAISKCTKVCWVGYGFEGMNISQLLYRTGQWRIVNLIEEYFRAQAKATGRPLQQLNSMSIQTFMRITPQEYGSKLGVLNQNDVKALNKLQSWYNSAASDDERLAAIEFINGYQNEFDDRTMTACIRASEQLITDTFFEAFPNNVLRMKTVGKDITKSLFPISKMQLNSYIETYLPKPGAAQNCINELINKPTTSVYTAEAQALKTFREAARDIHIKLAILKLKTPQKQIDVYIEKAEELYKKAKDETSRVLSSGREAQAALILRRHVLEYMLAYERLIITVQRRTRGLTQRIKWLKRKDRLRAGVRLAQRLYRGLRGRRFAAALSAEKFSDWEQLWNDKRQLMYYYNKITKESTYREPRGPFRPLLRDKKSYALVQAWPDLEGGLSEVESPTEKYLLPALYDQTGLSQTGYEMTSFEQQQETYPVIEGAGTYDPNNSLAESTWGGESEYDTQADFVPDPAFASTDTGTTGQLVNAEPPVNPMMCSVCKVRKYMRICFDCTGIGVNHRWAPSYTNGAYSSKFCFSCFALTHPSGDPDTKGHRTEESTLAAAVAAMAASQEDNFGETEGIALGQESKSLMCSVCSEPATRKCMGPLDDRHIDALCNEIHKASATSWVSILQSTGLWSDRRLSVLLEQVKGIDVGGNNVGASGRLSLAQLQEVRIMLERTRAECDDCYCASCYAEVHTGGKRSSHKWVGFQQHAAVCAVCSHSAAEVTCKDCATNYCNSCFRVFHSKGRKKKHSKEILLEDASNHYASRCVVCVRRLGALKCRDCDELCCDSCLECGAHKAVCVPNPIAGDISRPDTATSAYSAGRSLANAASSDWGVSDGGRGTKQVNCVVCGEPADQKCVQCRDHYCSRVWMGNPGCFAVQHSKGNRAKHVVQSLDNIDEGSPPASPNARRTIGNTMNMSQLPPLSPGSKQMSSTRKTKGEGRLK